MAKKYKILVLDTGKEWGGGTNSLIELLKRINKDRYFFNALFYYNYPKGNESDIKTEIEKIGFKFFLLHQKSQPIIVKILKEFFRIIFFFSKTMKKNIIFWIDYFWRVKPNAKKIAQIIKDLRVDLLYLNNQPSSNLEGIIASRLSNIPVIQHCRTRTKLEPFVVNISNSTLNKIICTSGGVKNDLIIRGINPDKCIVVYNGIDSRTKPSKSPEEIKEKLGISNDSSIIIGSVSSLLKRKRVDNLIDIISLIKKRSINNIKCIVVGEGPEKKKLLKYVHEKNLQTTIIFTGFQSDAISYINAMDIFLLTSESEGLPRVILEAMLMGKPVLAYNIPGPSDLIIDGETGYLISTGDTENFANHLLKLIEDKKLRIEMGKKAKERAIQHFSIENYISGVEKVFLEVLEK